MPLFLPGRPTPGSGGRRRVLRLCGAGVRRPARGIEPAIVTNGYTLVDYLDVLRGAKPRDVTEIPECKGRSLQPAGGCGCTAIAKNRTGQLDAPDCRPVPELLGMGVSLYFDHEDQRKGA